MTAPNIIKYTPDGPKKIGGTPVWRFFVVIIVLVSIGAATLNNLADREPKPDPTQPTPKPVAERLELTAAQKAVIAKKREQDRLERERKKAEVYEACKKELQCWGDGILVKAIIASQDLIERHAKYDFEWIDGFWGVKLIRFSWLDKSILTLKYFGDQIKFQNGFSGWQRCIYMVEHDPINDKVLGVKVQQGV